MCLPSLHCNEEAECFQGFEWGGTSLYGWKVVTAEPAGLTWALWARAAGDRAWLAVPRDLWQPKGCQWPSTLFSSSPALQGHMETESCVVPLDLYPPSLHAPHLEHSDLNFLIEDPFPLCLPYLKRLWPSARERAALGCGRHQGGPAGNSRANGGAALVCAGPCVCNLYYNCAMWYPRCAYALLPEMLS